MEFKTRGNPYPFKYLIIVTWFIFLGFPSFPGILAGGSLSDAGTPALSDEDILVGVELALFHDHRVPENFITVTIDQGIVTLSGTLDNLLAKDRAVQDVKTVKGVRGIINQIEVEPSHRVSDSELRQDVLAALLKDPATDSYELAIKVKNAIVTLSGTVDSWQEKQLSEQVAKGVKGIIKVENEILVVPEKTRPDQEIKPDITRRLEADPWVAEESITVKVDNGKVTLSGQVGTLDEKLRVYSDSWVAGVNDVDDEPLSVTWTARDDLRKTPSEKNPPDQKIREAIRDAFVYDPRVKAFHPQVTVVSGMVTLTGFVDNLMAKKAAEHDAMNTMGVWRVKNFLKVRLHNPPLDRQITQEVKGILVRDPYVDRYGIDVSTINGTVYLRGVVNYLFEKSLAEDLAARVPGVTGVKNFLTVNTSWNKKEDWEIKEDIQDELWWSPYVDSENISVRVYGGIAVLSGNVDSWHERRIAETNAYEGGANGVRNQLLVKYTPDFDRKFMN